MLGCMRIGQATRDAGFAFSADDETCAAQASQARVKFAIGPCFCGLAEVFDIRAHAITLIRAGARAPNSRWVIFRFYSSVRQ